MSLSLLARARWILLVGALATGGALALWHDAIFGLGAAAAGLWSLASVRALEGLLTAAVVPAGGPRDGRRVLAWSIAKIGVYGVAICALIVRPFPPASLLVGVTWLPIAFVIAALLPAPRSSSDAPSSGAPTRG